MHQIGFVISPGFQLLGLSMLTVFEMVNERQGGKAYRLRLMSEHGGPVTSSAGFAMQTEKLGRQKFDTLIVGAHMAPQGSSPGLLQQVRRMARHARRVAGPCTGAFVLAEAGLLDNRHATTHWAFAQDLQQQYRSVRVDADRIFVADGSLWTSAGMTASIDLALALVEADWGEALAKEIAQGLVLYHRRAGGQSQFSTLLTLGGKSDRVQKAMDYARSHLHTALSVQDLADAAHLSPRQFSRAFQAETGQSPAKAVEQLRVDAARLLLEQGRLPMETIAQDTGFGDTERMRRAFIRTLGHPPQAVRRQARAQGPNLVVASPPPPAQA